MRFALVNPNWSFQGSIYFGCVEPHLPLEYGYARALLEQEGHQALIVDGQNGHDWKGTTPVLKKLLEETGLFTTMMSNMVHIGEESGQLAPVMEQIAPYYKEKMETAISRVTKLLEPVIIMGMGITVAGLMMSIYLPMFEMAGKVH